MKELSETRCVPKRTIERSRRLRLKAQGWKVPEIAKIFECHEHTVRATLKRWEKRSLGGLWEAKGRGAKRKWQDSGLEYVMTCIEEDPRTYNSKQLAKKLKQERLVDLSSDRLGKLLRKKGYRWKQKPISHKKKQDLKKRQ